MRDAVKVSKDIYPVADKVVAQEERSESTTLEAAAADDETAARDQSVLDDIGVVEKDSDQETLSAERIEKGLSPKPKYLLTIPETRAAACIAETFDYASLEDHSVDIVIPINHERSWRVEKTVASILTHTPPRLLKSIILVDDVAFEHESEWDKIRAMSSKVLVHRNKYNAGLIQSKVVGARRGEAPVIVFLEGHVMVQRDWLEPLLVPIVDDYRTLTIPVLDGIDQKTYKYTKGGAFEGCFSWDLIYSTCIGNVDQHEPFTTEMMAGGLFAVSR